MNYGRCCLILAFAVAVGLMLMEPAYAQAGFGKVNTVLQNIINTIKGPVGISLAVLAVMILGIMFMYGQMDLRRAGAIALGIGLIFGATEIVSMVSG